MSAAENFPLPPAHGGVTVQLINDSGPLNDYLAQIAAVLTKHNKQIASLSEEVRSLKGQLQLHIAKTDDELGKQQRTTGVHDQQIRGFQQQVGQAVTTAQFNATVLAIKDQVKTIDIQVSRLDPSAGKRTNELMHQQMVDVVKQFNATVVHKEAEARHARTVEACRLHVERTVESVNERIDQQVLAPLNRQLASKASQEEIRKVYDTVRDSATHTTNRAQELATTTETALERTKIAMDHHLHAFAAKVDDLSARVAPLIAHSSGSGGSAPPSPSMQRGPLPLAGSLIGSVDGAAAVHNDANAVTIMASPTFLAFRQQIQEDIRQRIESSRAAQLSEVESELVDLRSELRQRTTPQRVIELIRQHQDVDTPARVADLNKRLDAVDGDKVSQAEFVEALRGKGDLLVLQAKADKVALEEVNGALAGKISRLDASMERVLAERSELQDVLRDVLYTHRRAQVLKDVDRDNLRGVTASGIAHAGGTDHGLSSSTQQLPAIGGRQSSSEAAVSGGGSGGVDPRVDSPRVPSRSTGDDGAVPVRNNSSRRSTKPSPPVGEKPKTATGKVQTPNSPASLLPAAPAAPVATISPYSAASGHAGIHQHAEVGYRDLTPRQVAKTFEEK